MEIIDLEKCITGIWNVAKNGFMPTLITVAESIVVLFLFVEIVKSAIDLAVHGQLTLDKKIWSWVIVLIVLANYKWISEEILLNSCVPMIKDSYKKLFKCVEVGSPMFYQKVSLFKLVTSSLFPVGIGGSVVLGLMGVFSLIIMALALAFTDIVVLGIFAGFTLLLLVGPILIPFAMTPGTRSITMQWVSNLLTSYLQFPILLISLNMAFSVVYKTSNELADKINKGSFTPSDYWPLFYVSLLPLGFILVGMSVSKSLLHGGGGGAMGAMMQPVTAAIGMVVMGVKTAVGVATKGAGGAKGSADSRKGARMGRIGFNPPERGSSQNRDGPMSENLSRNSRIEKKSVPIANPSQGKNGIAAKDEDRRNTKKEAPENERDWKSDKNGR